MCLHSVTDHIAHPVLRLVGYMMDGLEASAKSESSPLVATEGAGGIRVTGGIVGSGGEGRGGRDLTFSIV